MKPYQLFNFDISEELFLAMAVAAKCVQYGFSVRIDSAARRASLIVYCSTDALYDSIRHQLAREVRLAAHLL